MAFGRKRKYEREEAALDEQPQVGDESAETVEGRGEQPANASTAVAYPQPFAESAQAPSGEAGFVAAAADAGDPAAAGTDASGPGAEASTIDAQGAPQTAQASPEAAAIPAASTPVGELGGATPPSGGDQGLSGADGAPGPERVQGVVEERPEVLVAGAFLGGIVLARLLSALGGRR